MKKTMLLRLISLLLLVILCVPALPALATEPEAETETEPEPLMAFNVTEVYVALKNRWTVTIKYPDGAKARKVEWKSSDRNIARVNKGRITGYKVGDCTVTATATMRDGSTRTASLPVHVFRRITSFTLTNSKLTLATGESSKPLQVKILPKEATYQEVTWSSSNALVASVDEKGVVTGLMGGTAIITATSKEPARAGKKSLMTSCRVVVTQGVSDVTIKQDDPVGVALKKKIKLTVSVLPDNATSKKVKWTSSDSKIAKVDQSGNVTGVKEGVATITATAQDGSKKSDSREVHVYVAATAIETKRDLKLTLREGDLDKVEVTLKPAKATPTAVLWTSSNEEVATVEDGEITAVAPGTCEITAAANYGTNKVKDKKNSKLVLVFQVTVTAAETESPDAEV